MRLFIAPGRSESFMTTDVTINDSVSVLRHANLSFPRTRESRRGEVDGGRMAWMPASAGMTNRANR